MKSSTCVVILAVLALLGCSSSPKPLFPANTSPKDIRILDGVYAQRLANEQLTLLVSSEIRSGLVMFLVAIVNQTDTVVFRFNPVNSYVTFDSGDTEKILSAEEAAKRLSSNITYPARYSVENDWRNNLHKAHDISPGDAKTAFMAARLKKSEVYTLHLVLAGNEYLFQFTQNQE